MTDAIIALGNFESILPKIRLSQEETLAQIEKAHTQHAPDSNIPVYLKRFGVKSQQIATRNFETLELPLRDADIEERTRFFGEQAFARFQEFYPEKKKAPAHIVHVTCTGYISPSAPRRLVDARNWNGGTNVTHAYHMGCYAAMPAIRMAEGFVAAKKRAVDIVHTELCGLHLDGHLNTPEQLVVQTLFADGHIKYTASRPEELERGFRVLDIREQIVPDSGQDMSWVTSSKSMHMTLSRQVPEKIGVHLRDFVMKLAPEKDLAKILKTARFAVHPGGPKIIDAVKQTLELSEEQVSASREILRTHGNMSSATLPHVWQRLLEDDVKGPVISLAFGPGLTIFGATFETF